MTARSRCWNFQSRNSSRRSNFNDIQNIDEHVRAERLKARTHVTRHWLPPKARENPSKTIIQAYGVEKGHTELRICWWGRSLRRDLPGPLVVLNPSEFRQAGHGASVNSITYWHQENYRGFKRGPDASMGGGIRGQMNAENTLQYGNIVPRAMNKRFLENVFQVRALTNL